jgi:hypothetical protein
MRVSANVGEQVMTSGAKQSWSVQREGFVAGLLAIIVAFWFSDALYPVASEEPHPPESKD